MSKRLAVLRAVQQVIAAALPGADVAGPDDENADEARVTTKGRVVIRAGDPGEPSVDLSPLTYHFDHIIPIEVLALNETKLDQMLGAIGAAVAADPTLGGLCEFAEPTGADGASVPIDNGRSLRGADLAIVASYATTNPLT